MIQLDWDIPSSCQECRFSVDGWCYAIRAEDSQPSELCYLTRPEWCPLRDAASPWHRVEEELPKEDGKYLVYMFTSAWRWEFKFAGYLHGRWIGAGGGDVRYWMPIEPPKEDA